jgi:hypothetical protein
MFEGIYRNQVFPVVVVSHSCYRMFEGVYRNRVFPAVASHSCRMYEVCWSRIEMMAHQGPFPVLACTLVLRSANLY